MAECRVLVMGGYGFFGHRLARRLARIAGLHVIVAGRSAARAQALAHELRDASVATVEAVALDGLAPGLAAELNRLRVHMVVNASGPFQEQDYRIAKACIAAGIHYIDLADSRDFVAGIGALNQAALSAGVCVTSGASSVPALSSAAADALAKGMSRVCRIAIGISPGNRTERGLATIRSVLSYCGKPLPCAGGQTVFGWTGTRRHAYSAPVGQRLLSPCDVPDLVLLPSRYPGTPEVRFDAGLELGFMHRGMNFLALVSRCKLVRDWSRYAVPLKWISDLFVRLGSDAGAMHVSVEGVDHAGRAVRRTWQLLATHGDGPYIPTLAAAALVARLAGGETPRAAAMPCIGMLSLADFGAAAQGLNISMEVIA